MGKSLSLMLDPTLKTPPSAGAAASSLGVMGNLCKATAPAKKPAASPSEPGSGEPGNRRLGEASSGEEGSGEGGSGEGPAARSAESIQFALLRASISSLGDATLKGTPSPNPSPNLTLALALALALTFTRTLDPNRNPNPSP